MFDKIHTFLYSYYLGLSRRGGYALVIVKVLRLVRRFGIAGLNRLMMRALVDAIEYAAWIRKFDVLAPEDREAIGAHLATLSFKPLISVVMPVFNPDEKWLRRAIVSVQEQLYPHWELCIADDRSTLPHVRQVLDAAAATDSRIKVMYRTENGHISAASNSALALAGGEFVALVDHDDELAPHALYMVAVELNACPDANLLYSDEDKIDRFGRRFQPYFKPDWNPDLLLSQNFISHLGVYRTALLREIGGFRIGYEGCQDWDLAWRVAERSSELQIRHIPHVLYHWRTARNSTAAGQGNKPYVVSAACRTIADHFARAGIAAEAQAAHGGYVRARYALPHPPLVSIIIPTRNRIDLLKRCLDSVYGKTDYPAFEILVVDNQSDDAATLAYLDQLRRSGKARVLPYDAPFNYAAITNYAVKEATGETICLLNNDTEVISEDWLHELVSHAARPEVGAVGAMLYYGNGTIQHAGVIIGMGGVAAHWHAGVRRGMTGYFSRASLTQNLSAVTGACMVMRKAVFEEIGGMNAERLAVAFNDIDLCLRLRERGYHIVWTPYAELFHHESASRGKEDSPEKLARFHGEIHYMEQRWSAWIRHDPAYNPKLSLTEPKPRLAWTPRVEKPWKAMIAAQ